MRLRLVFLLKSSESVEWGNAMNEPQTTFLAYGKCCIINNKNKNANRNAGRIEWMDWIHSRCVVDNSRLGLAFVLRRLFTEQSRFFVVGHRETQKNQQQRAPSRIRAEADRSRSFDLNTRRNNTSPPPSHSVTVCSLSLYLSICSCIAWLFPSSIKQKIQKKIFRLDNFRFLLGQQDNHQPIINFHLEDSPYILGPRILSFCV